MLTGDQNIINLAYAVRWKIKNPELYLFELAEPEQTVREVGESAMRAEISKATLNDAIGPQRAQIAEQVRERMQELLDSYRAGIEVRGVDIKQADPPAAVDDAFKDVSAAQQDAQQYLNQSRAYAQQLLASAQGSAAAFDAVYAQYRLAPEVTRKRMYLETMESVLSKVDKTVIEPGNVQTYLPLPEIAKRARRGRPDHRGGQFQQCWRGNSSMIAAQSHPHRGGAVRHRRRCHDDAVHRAGNQAGGRAAARQARTHRQRL